MKSMAEVIAMTDGEVDRSEFFGRLIPRRHKLNKPTIPGICADARRLGVSRMHLWAVLSGRRESEGLVKRYEQMKGMAV